MKKNDSNTTPSLSRNFAVYLFKTIVVTLAPIITFPYASRVLGPIGIGRVQYAQTWVGYFQLLACLGINSYAIREGTRCRHDREKLGKLCTELLYISCGTTVIAYAIFFAFTFTFAPLRDYRGLLIMCSISIVANSLSVEWLYSIFEDYTYISVRSIVIQLIALLMLFVLVRSREDYYFYAFVLIFPSMGSMILNLIHSRKIIRWGGYGGYRYLHHLKPIFMIFGITVTANLFNSIDTTMLGLYMGDQEVGYYTTAVKLARNVMVLVSAMCTVFSPRSFYYAGLEDKTKFFDLTQKSIHIIMGVAIPCGIGLTVLAPQFIWLFGGPEFEAAVPAMYLLSINLIFTAINGLLGWQILLTMNKEKLSLYATALGCVIDFVLNCILIPPYGSAGAALATIVTEITVFIIFLVLCGRMMPILKYFSGIWQYFVAALTFVPICAAANYLFKDDVLAVVISTVVLCSGAYVFVLWKLNNPMFFFAVRQLKKKLPSMKH